MKENNKLHLWYAASAGLFSLFIGIGLCRFAYTPLMPILINQNWLDKTNASYLGAINLIGYLLCAIFARRISKYFDSSVLIKINLILCVVSLGFCAINLGFLWLAFWRFIAGWGGAFLLILTPSVILKKITIKYRGRISGLMFTGLGLGIVLSGSFFPMLSKTDVRMAWLSAASIALVVTLISWRAFSNNSYEAAKNDLCKKSEPSNLDGFQYTIILLTISYVLYGIGMVPHTLFLVDYVHRELGLSLIKSGMFWSVFGIGATIGPFCAGFLADNIGLYRSLITAFSLGCLGVLLIIFNHIMSFYIISSFLIGILMSSIPMLLSSRLLELIEVAEHPEFWGRITLYCAISQATAAYLMSYLLHIGIQYTVFFFVADLVFVAGLIAIVFARMPASLPQTLIKT